MAVMPCPQRPCQRGSCREGPQVSVSASITCKRRLRVCHLSPRNFPKRFKASKTSLVGASGRKQESGGCPRTERVQAAPPKAPLSNPESPRLCSSHGRAEAGAVCLDHALGTGVGQEEFGTQKTPFRGLISGVSSWEGVPAEDLHGLVLGFLLLKLLCPQRG